MKHPRVVSAFVAVAAVAATLSASLWIHLTPARTAAVGPPESARLGKRLVHHCGIIPLNSDVPVRIALFNDLPESISIRNVDVTCGCLKLVACNKVIKSGESGTLELSFHATVPGTARQRVSVITDVADPTRSIFQIELTANVRGGWSEPKTLAFGRISVAAPVHRELVVSLSGYRDVQLLRTSSDSPHLQAQRAGSTEVLPTERATDTSEKRFAQPFRVWWDESTPAGTAYANFRTRWAVDGESIDVVTPVMAEVTGIWTCTPSQVVWIIGEASDRERPLRTEIRISAGRGSVNVSQLAVTCDLEVVAARRLHSDASSVVLEVSRSDIPLDPDGGTLRGTIVGKAGSSTCFQIPVLIVFNNREGETSGR